MHNNNSAAHAPFGDEDIVRQTVNDHSTFTLFYDVGENRKCRRETGISVREDIDVRALLPIHVQRRVNGAFDIIPIEVQWRDLNLLKGATVGMVSQSTTVRICVTYGNPSTSHRMGY